MVLMDIGLQAARAVTEEDPLDICSQGLDHRRDNVQISCLLAVSDPTQARPGTRAPPPLDIAPGFDRQARLNHSDIRVQAGKSLRQRRCRHHQAVHIPQSPLQVMENIFAHALAPGAAQRQIRQVVAQIKNREGTRECLNPPHGLQTRLVEPTLEHHHVRGQPLQLNQLRHPWRHLAIDAASCLQCIEGTNHPRITQVALIKWMKRQYRHLTLTLRRMPRRLQAGNFETASMGQRQMWVVGWIMS
ncbi:hypothetical protein D3C81_787110 [compost metagenome]